MIRTLALTALLFTASTQTARAQAATAAKDTLVTRFVGTWDGKFTTDQGSGGIQITVAKPAAWKLSIEMSHGDQAFPVGASDVKVAGKTISWNQDVMGATCPASAAVAGEKMTGEITCSNMTIKLELERK
jgi:hypothetical protein